MILSLEAMKQSLSSLEASLYYNCPFALWKKIAEEFGFGVWKNWVQIPPFNAGTIGLC